MLGMTKNILLILLAALASTAHAGDHCTFSTGQFGALRLNSGHGKFLVIAVTQSKENLSVLKEVCDATLQASKCLSNRESEPAWLFLHDLPQWISQFINPVYGSGWNKFLNTPEECEIARSEFAIFAAGRAHSAIATRPEEQKHIRESVYRARPW